MTNKLCLYCENWYMEYEGDWSEVTLGNGFTTGCREGKWYMSELDLDEEKYRNFMEISESCGLYKERIIKKPEIIKPKPRNYWDN